MGSLFLITGRPGVGKTTLVRRILAEVPGRAGGFTTEEIRGARGARRGFLVRDLDGPEGILARADMPGPPRVGRYGVDVASFEAVGLAALRRALAERDLIVIDEIGKMEFCSAAFAALLERVLASPKPLLATILRAPHPDADRVKGHPEARLFVVTPANRDTLARTIVHALAPLVAPRP